MTDRICAATQLLLPSPIVHGEFPNAARSSAMSVFTEIRNAIFGYPGQPQQLEQAHRRAMPQLADADEPPPVDVEAVLAELHRDKSSPDLRWRSSVADLMTLLDLDSGPDARKALAHELGYEGEFDESPESNLWLYRRLMQELEASGARVSPALLH
jgi:hypothetical protein